MSRVSSENISLIQQLLAAKERSLTLTTFFAKARPILADAKKVDETRSLAEPLSGLLLDLGWSDKEPDYALTQAAVTSLLDGCLSSLQRGEFPSRALGDARAALDSFLEGHSAVKSRGHLPVLTQGLLSLTDALFRH